jgi:carboxyl-terminal processing protease
VSETGARLPLVLIWEAGQKIFPEIRAVNRGTYDKLISKKKSVKTFVSILSLSLVCALAIPGLSVRAEVNEPSSGQGQTEFDDKYLREILEKAPPNLIPGANDSAITRMVAQMLVTSHFSRLPLDERVASQFLERYLDSLDPMRLHFTQEDLADFQSYRRSLHELIREGDLTPAHEVYRRFLRRLEQRVAYVRDLLNAGEFDFATDERYNLNRRKEEHPGNLEEARRLWHKHLRHEILQEKLNEEPMPEILHKIGRRYVRLLKTFKEYEHGDVFEIYLSSLAHIFDPHSSYLGKSSLDAFRIGMNLSLFGIGALLQSEDGYCKIKSLVPNGPADKSQQIKENDRIIAVAQGDGEPEDVVDVPLNKVVNMIRGPKGTEVRLTIIPADAADPSVRRVVTLVRDEIPLEDQEAKARLIDMPVEDGKKLRVGVIDLPSFYASFDPNDRKEPRSTTVDVAKLLRKLKRESVEGIILDLRRNGGGSLEEAINLTGLFIKEGPIVQVKDPSGTVMVDSDTDDSILYDGPLIVLTSRLSASASEILAGALQDYGRALIVGDSSTYGKGTVQSLMRLEPYMRGFRSAGDPGALKVTIRKFYRASGASTQLKGVVPDIVLPSVNNHLEVGEAALENALAWDVISSARYTPVNRIEPILEDLQERSKERIEQDPDFVYVYEDIEQVKKALADRSVSLNLEQRLQEKRENEERNKLRREELKARPLPDFTVYEISLKAAEQPGLPDPLDQEALQTSGVDEEESPGLSSGHEEETPKVDVTMNEAKRILTDLIDLLQPDTSVAAKNPGL